MKTNRMPLVLSALSVAVTISATQAGAVAIANGGFEAQAGSVPLNYVLAGPVTGWNGGTYLTSAGYYSATPPEGRIFALIGNGIDTGGSHLSQTITGLTSGSRYTVKFAIGSEDFVIPGTVEQVNVWMSTGSSSASQVFSAPISSNATAYGGGPLWDNWGYFNYSFIANGTSATLNFEQTSATTGSGDTGLDDVSISSGAPEPATWAMMLLGTAGLGGMVRRRRQARLSA